MSSFSTILHAFVTPLTRVVTSIPEWAKSEHIKTVGGQSILGEGDIPLSGVTLDDTVTQTSQNGVKSSGIWSWVRSLLPSWLTSSYAEPATVASVNLKADRANTYTKGEADLEIDGAVSAHDESNTAHADIRRAIVAFAADLQEAIDAEARRAGSVEAMLAQNKADDADLQNHVSNGDIHVGYGERAAWNAKVDVEDLAAYLPDATPAYSASATYAVGEFVRHEGAIYCCKTAITTAEAWTPAHWTEMSNVADYFSESNTKLTGVIASETADKITNPSGGVVGNVLKKTANGVEWGEGGGGSVLYCIKVDPETGKPYYETED